MVTLFRAFAFWLLRLTGVEVNPALTRDSRGRFRPKDAPPRGVDEQADVLEDAGISPRLQRAAHVGLAPPADVHDTAAMQRSLREYIVANMDGWIVRRPRSLWMVFAALKDTYALDQKQYAVELSAARAARLASPAARAGAGPAPARKGERDIVTLRYIKPQPRAGFKQDHDCSLAAKPTASDACHATEHTELHMPEGSAQRGTDAEQGAERPCHSSIRKTGEALRASSYAAAYSGCDPAISNSNSLDTPTTAGGHKALPYEVSPAWGPGALGVDPEEPEVVELTIPRYDPDYDVVGNLDKSIRNARCPADYLQGFGNTPQAAEDAYYSRNQAEFKHEGMNWAEFGMPCKVYEAYDDQERAYFIARADPYGLLELMKARSEAFQAVAHPMQEDPFEQDGGLTTKDTKDTKIQEVDSTSSESNPNLRDLCVLSGDSPSVDISTTPWKGSLRGREYTTSLNGAAANLEPLPLNLEPPSPLELLAIARPPP